MDLTEAKQLLNETRRICGYITGELAILREFCMDRYGSESIRRWSNELESTLGDVEYVSTEINEANQLLEREIVYECLSRHLHHESEEQRFEQLARMWRFFVVRLHDIRICSRDSMYELVMNSIDSKATHEHDIAIMSHVLRYLGKGTTMRQDVYACVLREHDETLRIIVYMGENGRMIGWLSEQRS